MNADTKQAGINQAAENGITKLCPKCSGKPMLFAGDGSYDYEIICESCGFTVHRNSKKATIRRWEAATEKAKSEA